MSTTTDRLHQITDFHFEVEHWMIYIGSRFRKINGDKNLTPDDKKRLKEFYLETCVTPRVREAVKKYFPEEFAAGQRPGSQR